MLYSVFIIIKFLYVVGNNDKTMQWLEKPANVFNYRSSSEFSLQRMSHKANGTDGLQR